MSKSLLTSSQYQNYRPINLIVIHCSGTPCDCDVTPQMITAWHQSLGFATIGYHYYITRDGEVHAGRPLYQIGAHALGYNAHSIGVCYEGGMDAFGDFADTRTPEQRESLRLLLKRLREDYPEAVILGHNDLPGVNKACPCFDAELEYRNL